MDLDWAPEYGVGTVKLFGPVFALVVLVVIWTMAGGLPPFDLVSDGSADWVFARAAWSGVEPWHRGPEVGVHLGMSLPDMGWPSKTPAVALVAAPLLAMPLAAVEPVMIFVDLAAIGGIVWLAARIAGREIRWWVWPLLATAAPVRTALGWANPIFVWVLLILATWWMTTRRDRWTAGIPLGVAGAVRLWPLLIVVALWRQGNRRAAYTAAGVGVGLNLAGLLVPGISFAGAWRGLVSAGENWSAYGVSIGGLLGGSRLVLTVVVLAGCAAAVWVSARRRDPVGAVTLIAVLVSPISWMHYYLAAAPVFARTWPLSLVPAALVGSGVWQLAVAGGVILLALELRAGQTIRRVDTLRLVGRVEPEIVPVGSRVDGGGG